MPASLRVPGGPHEEAGDRAPQINDRHHSGGTEPGLQARSFFKFKILNSRFNILDQIEAQCFVPMHVAESSGERWFFKYFVRYSNYMENKQSSLYINRLKYIILFAIAMGYFEAALVVYLREFLYPEGFAFPFKVIPLKLAVIEIAREAATVVMLIAVSALAGKKFWERFGYFIILFGIWDIFYYVFLRLTIGWPSTIFEWDVLFLIPLPWIGPVLAPVLVAILMIVCGLLIIRMIHTGRDFRVSRSSWIVACTATALILFSFMRDFDATLHQQLPQPYWYWLLVVGLALYCWAFVQSYILSNK